MRNTLLLLLCIQWVALVCAIPARFGSGVNLAGMEFGSGKKPGRPNFDYVAPTTAEIDYYWARGLRNFRIPFLWERMQQTLNGELDTPYFNMYNAAVQHAISKGATVILDPHNYARYNGTVIGASNTVTTANFIDFWIKFGNKYKSQADLTVFGLMNEPHGMSSASWFSTVQATINALRAADITNTILIPGNAYTGAHSWSSTSSYISTDRPVVSNAAHAANITDPLSNIVFEVHQYFDSDYSGSHVDCTSGRTATSILKNFENFLTNNNAYGYLGEYAGASNDVCETIVIDVLEHIRDNPRWLGSSWWAGGPWWGNYMYLLETSNLDGNVTQMNWLGARTIPYERYAGYKPTSAVAPSNNGNALATSWALLSLAFTIAIFVTY